jgi:hypothetical protein
MALIRGEEYVLAVMSLESFTFNALIPWHLLIQWKTFFIWIYESTPKLFRASQDRRLSLFYPVTPGKEKFSSGEGHY